MEWSRFIGKTHRSTVVLILSATFYLLIRSQIRSSYWKRYWIGLILFFWKSASLLIKTWLFGIGGKKIRKNIWSRRRDKMKATPISYAPVESSEQVKRMVCCSHYGTCLDYAIEKSWPGFPCEECHAYERERMDEEQWDEDRQRCLTLIYFVLFPKLKLQVCKSSPSFGKREIRTIRAISPNMQAIGFIGNEAAIGCNLTASC